MRSNPGIFAWRPAGAGLSILVILAVAAALSAEERVPEASDSPAFVQSASLIDAGRYLVVVAGCNDCHTAGYLETGGNVPESDWLTGSPLGWRGPWGTTYASNLRMLADSISEDAWVAMLRSRKDRPPMPWMNVNRMSGQDARALYAYLKSLGSAGKPAPLALAPGVEPATPYVSMMPTIPATVTSAAPDAS